jgi:hypothetical protein
MVDVLDFLMGCESNLQTDRKTSSFVTLVVDVFSFHLQIFHWFIAPPSRRYFQGHSPWENPKRVIILFGVVIDTTQFFVLLGFFKTIQRTCPDFIHSKMFSKNNNLLLMSYFSTIYLLVSSLPLFTTFFSHFCDTFKLQSITFLNGVVGSIFLIKYVEQGFLDVNKI